MKFESSDASYLTRRQALSERSGPRELWSVIDHWPLYCGVGNLARFLAIYELLKSTFPVPGHVAEFGSWRGANLMFMAKVLRILDPHGPKLVHAFDSFQGLSAFAAQDGVAQTMRDHYRGDQDELSQVIELYDAQHDVVIHAGLIEDTLPAVLAADPALSFSFVYCDTDLYASTRLILEQLDARLSVGGLFVLDEWNHELYPGEGVAANEFIAAHGDRYEVRAVPMARQPTLVLQKRRSHR